MADRGREREGDNNNPKLRAASFDVYKNLAGQSQGRESSERRSASVPPPTDNTAQIRRDEKTEGGEAMTRMA